MKHCWKTSFPGLLVLLLALPYAASTAWAEHAPFVVQYKSFQVPVRTAAGEITRKRITLYVEAEVEWAVETLCRVLPRLKEAIYLELEREPVEVDFRRLKIDGLALRLLPELNQALSQPLIEHLTIVPAAVKMAKGTKIARIPGATEDCVPLLSKPSFLKDYPSASPQDVVDARPGAVLGKPFEESSQAKVKRKRVFAGSRVYLTKNGEIVGDDGGEEIQAVTTSNKKCIRNIDRVWPSSLHSIDNRWYWLQQIRTIDENKDGVVDNLAFELKSEGLADQRVYYYVTGTAPSVSKVETLRLEDERLIALLCENEKVYHQPPGGRAYPAGYIPPSNANNYSFNERLMIKVENIMAHDMFWVFVFDIVGIVVIAVGFLIFLSWRRRQKELDEQEEAIADEERQFFNQRKKDQRETRERRNRPEAFLDKGERRSRDRRHAQDQRREAKNKD